MHILKIGFDWLTDPVNWHGDGGIPHRLLEHLELSGAALLAALIPAVLLGLYIGHARRFEFVTISVANLGRAIPSFAILAIFFPISLQLGLGLGFWPAFVALFLLGIPPIITNTYVGIKGVDTDTLEAARGMGMSGVEILRKIELPLAIPLIIAGVRTSAVQIVATATLAAVIAYGGLGRYIVDGFALGQSDEGRAEVFGGAVLVALLAILIELAFGVFERLAAPRTHSRTSRNWVPRLRHVGQVPRVDV